MGERLNIQTLGSLSIQEGNQPVEFETRKEAALLVYLACTGRPHPREVLAEMLWEDRPQSQSLANLRHVLAELRRCVQPYVMITRDTVAMNPASEWWLDTTAFETCLTSHGGVQLDQLEEAVDLYRGEFLAGVYVDSRAFDGWALLERERLRLCAMETLDRLVHHHTTRRNYRAGIARAIQQLHIDPLREETHRHLMRLLALSGQRAKALEQYETCRRVLDDELGVEPMPETITLYDRIRAGEVDQPLLTPVSDAPGEQVNDSVPAVTPHNLPAQATSFVGREMEITEVLHLLADLGCRLVTLLGPGGIGKTRLALAIAERALESYASGVYFVELAALNTPDVLVASIAASVGCQFNPGQGSQEQQLLRFLGEKTLLLLRDNFEHLLEGMDVLVTLLEGAPNLKLLVTSRQALNLGWEWPYDLRGLAAPIDRHDPDAMRYDAVQLFIARARRAQAGFSLAEHHTAVIRACQLVEGMPLAIELAAAWLRLMPLPDILAVLVDLETPQRDVPERHRSLRALFDHTWAHLSPREQDGLMNLAVFRGASRVRRRRLSRGRPCPCWQR